MCPRCGTEMHEVYFGDELRRWRCMKCERLYVLWEYRVWGQERDDLQVREEDGAREVAG